MDFNIASKQLKILITNDGLSESVDTFWFGAAESCTFFVSAGKKVKNE